MEDNSVEPPNTGQQNRQLSHERFTRNGVRRKRLTLMTVLWVAKAIWKVARVIESMIDDS